MKDQKTFSVGLRRGVVTAGESATAKHVARLMNEHNIGAVVIMRGEKLVGIISERDIARRIVARGLSPEKTKVKAFMTKDVMTANFREGFDKIYEILSHAKFRHLPIMNKGKLVGIVSQRDMLYSEILKKTD